MDSDRRKQGLVRREQLVGLTLPIRLISLKFLETEVLKAKSGFEEVKGIPPLGWGGPGWT